MRLMLSPQMMSLLAVYIAFEVKPRTGQSHRSWGGTLEGFLFPLNLWFCLEWGIGGLVSVFS